VTNTGVYGLYICKNVSLFYKIKTKISYLFYFYFSKGRYWYNVIEWTLFFQIHCTYSLLSKPLFYNDLSSPVVAHLGRLRVTMTSSTQGKKIFFISLGEKNDFISTWKNNLFYFNRQFFSFYFTRWKQCFYFTRKSLYFTDI
jgi:hypothetical protein